MILAYFKNQNGACYKPMSARSASMFLIEEYRNSFKERDDNSLVNQDTLFGTDLFSGYSIRRLFS